MNLAMHGSYHTGTIGVSEPISVTLAAGNTLGIARVETEVAVPDAPEAEPVFHTVKKGDTLWKIAETHYGNGSKYNAVFEANKPMLEHPDKIYPGQTLRIPKL